MFFAGFISLYNIHRIQASTCNYHYSEIYAGLKLGSIGSEDVILVSDMRKKRGKEERKRSMEGRKEGREGEEEEG